MPDRPAPMINTSQCCSAIGRNKLLCQEDHTTSAETDLAAEWAVGNPVLSLAVNRSQPAGEFGAVEPLDRFAARREEACGRSDVDVRDEQSFFTVWLVAEQRPI